jgi:pyruvate formate lyase activating enzyme
MISRRHFIKNCSAASCLLFSGGMGRYFSQAHAEESGPKPIEARYYQKLANRKIKCVLCPRECVIDDLERGYCGVRENHNGTYYTLVYGKPCTAHIDPIEKKPLFHFLPGTEAFSIATVGCNVFCKFCQNWEISQSRPEQVKSFVMPPRMVAQIAKEKKCASISLYV